MSIGFPTAWAVKKLGAAHAGELAALEAACFSTPWTEPDFLKAFQGPYFSVFGAFRQEVPEAYLSLHHGFGEMEILNIATSATCRRQGAARALLAHALALMPELDAKTAFLEVRETNTPAKNLYYSMGFTQVGRRKAYYQDTGEDALVLALVSEGV